MAFILRLAVTTRELGPVLEHMLKNADVKLLDCQLAERPAAAPKLPKTRGQVEALRAIINEAVEIGAEFAPALFLNIASRKMPKGQIYSALVSLTKRGFIEKIGTGKYARVK